jgi:hypothetical protein
MLRHVEIARGAYRSMAPRAAAAGRKAKIQFNIRVDAEVLARFRDYCARNGLDPQGQIVLFMKRVLDSEFDFQERLWTALQAESP